MNESRDERMCRLCLTRQQFNQILVNCGTVCFTRFSYKFAENFFQTKRKTNLIGICYHRPRLLIERVLSYFEIHLIFSILQWNVFVLHISRCVLRSQIDILL